MLHPLSPGSSGDMRPSKSVVGGRSRNLVLSSRDDGVSAVAPPIATRSAKTPVANGHSRTSSEPLPHRLHHPTSPTALPSQPPPPPTPPPRTRGAGLQDSSLQLPDAFDNLTFSSIDSASIASSAGSDTHQRIRRICSKPDVPLRRHNSAPRTFSPTEGPGDNHTERRPLEQTLRDRCGQETGDSADIRPSTPKGRRIGTSEMPVNFADEMSMPSSPPQPYGNSGRATRSGPSQATGRVRTILKLAEDPPIPNRASATMDTSTVEQGGGILLRQDMENRMVGGFVSKGWEKRRASDAARRASRRPDVSNQGADQHGKGAETAQRESTRAKPVEGSAGSSSTARPPSAPIPNTTTGRGGDPERKLLSRLSERAKSTKEGLNEGRSKQVGFLAGPERSVSASALDARPSTARGNPSPRAPVISRSSKGSASPRPERKQSVSAIASPGRMWPRRERQPITKPATSPVSAPSLPPSEPTAATNEFARDRVSLRAKDGRSEIQKLTLTKEGSLGATSARTLEPSTSIEVPKDSINNPRANGKAPASEGNNQPDLGQDDGDIFQKISGAALSSSPNSWSTFESNHSPKEPSSRRFFLEREGNPGGTNAAKKPSEPRLTRIGAHLQARTQGMSDTPTPKAAGNGSGLFSQSLLQSPEIGDYDELLAAAVSTTRAHPQHRARAPRATTARPKAPIPAVHRPRRSRLEDEDSDVDSLQYLIDNDRDFSALFCPSSDEDDTALLLSGGQPYRPIHRQAVRPRSEAQAGDEQCERERAVHEKLMNRLRTLQLEVRSTSRGINVLEGFLGSSDDNSEFVDDDEAKVYLKKLRKERENERLKLELRLRQRTGGARNLRVTWWVKWGFPALLIVLLWYAVELAVYLHSIPPSYSEVRLHLAPPHRFGSGFINFSTRLFGPTLDVILLLVRGVLLGTIKFASSMLANSGYALSSIWRPATTATTTATTTTTAGPGEMYASMSGGGSVPPLGSDQIIS